MTENIIWYSIRRKTGAAVPVHFTVADGSDSVFDPLLN